MISQHIDQFYSLTEKERQIIKSAIKSGDGALTREVLQRYFPMVPPDELTRIVPDLRSMP